MLTIILAAMAASIAITAAAAYYMTKSDPLDFECQCCGATFDSANEWFMHYTSCDNHEKICK